MPGHQYLGPGTKIVNNLSHLVIPTDDTDMQAMIHDTEYLLANTLSDIEKADQTYSQNVTGLEGLLTSTALKVKHALGMDQKFLNPQNINEHTRNDILKKVYDIQDMYMPEMIHPMYTPGRFTRIKDSNPTRHNGGGTSEW